MSSGHLDALANATSKLDEAAKAEFAAHEAELLAAARGSSVESFDRHCRDLVRTIAADDGANTAMTYDQMEAQAFIDIVTGSTTLDRRIPEVIVLVDLDTLLNGRRDESLCETSNGFPLPPATMRRLCCEANIIPAVLDGDGEPLDLGRGKRLASPAQRRAILAMYRTCGFPGCTVSVDHCAMKS